MVKVELFHQDNWKERLKALGPELIPRPNTGRLWHDCLFLLLICAIQLAILPSIFGPFISIDLVTPWLVTSFVRQNALSAVILAIVGAAAIESHSSMPSGLYFCAYWIALTIIIQVRPTLSWRHQIPWLVNFILAQLWIVTFEVFVMTVINRNALMDIVYWLNCLVKIPVATCFGLYISRQWMNLDAEEPVP